MFQMRAFENIATAITRTFAALVYQAFCSPAKALLIASAAFARSFGLIDPQTGDAVDIDGATAVVFDIIDRDNQITMLTGSIGGQRHLIFFHSGWRPCDLRHQKFLTSALSGLNEVGA